MDLASLDKATDYVAACEALWPDLPQRTSEGHIWMADPRDPGERSDAFSINTDSGMWQDHKTGDGGNLLTLVKDSGAEFKAWAKACPSAAKFLPGSKKKAGGGLGLRNIIHPEAASQPSAPAPEEVKAATFAEEMTKYERMEKAEWVVPFADAWGVDHSLLRAHGSCFAASRGRNTGKCVWNLAMRSPCGAVVGIKSRALEDIWKSGGKTRKSNNRGKTGLVGWDRNLPDEDVRPLLFVEGEKDFIVARGVLSDSFLVVGTLGGAGTFKEEWAEAVRDSHRDVYFCYDNDDNEAGWTGALKAARKVWTNDNKVHVVYLPTVGTDVFDFLRGKDGVCEASSAEQLLDIIKTAEAMGDMNPGDVRATIQAHLDDEGLRKDDLAMSRALYQQILDHGGRFYHDTLKAYLLWHKKVFIVDKDDSGWAILQGDLAGLSPFSPVGSRVVRGVRALALQRGGRMEASAWQARRPGALFLPLYNEAAELLRVSPEGLVVVPNGTEDVVLLADPRVKPITFLPDTQYDADRAKEIWDRTMSYLNVDPAWQHFMSAFGRSFLFYDWCGTHPHLRFQGSAGSGKSTGFKLLNTIITGSTAPVGGQTMAGIWRSASSIPLVAFDDMEAKQLRREPWMVEFLLRAAVGGQREMAQADSQTGVHVQTVGCHIMSNGISPITSNTPALAERIIVVPTLPKEGLAVGFYERGILDDLLKNRNLIWNYLFREAQRILGHLEQGAIQNLMRQMPGQKRQRLHEFFSLLSVTLGHAEKPAPFVEEWLDHTQEDEEDAKVEGSGLVTLLLNIPAYLDAPDEQMAPGAKALRGIDTFTNGRLWEICQTTHILHTVFQSMRKDRGLPYHAGSAQELGNELAALAKLKDRSAVELTNIRRRLNGKQIRAWSLKIDLDEATPIGRPKPTIAEETNE